MHLASGFAGVPRSVAISMVGHKTESVYRRYAIADEKARRAAADALGALHERQAKATGRVVLIGKRGR
ncbi:MAG TPA: hypothetical protein VN461_00805 [Vicinamibacteria bacterium]|nr:hypothetical protein [Vicinamibacteria bacterium]